MAPRVSGGPPFVGRTRELALLARVLGEVRRSGSGRIVAIRGRRQVGKSRLAEIFCERSGAPSVYFQATRQRPPHLEIEGFRALAAGSLDDAAVVLGSAAFHTWDGVLAALGEAVEQPTIVVIDELPWLIEQDGAVEGALQTAFDRHLKVRPILVVLIGSDLAMMEALTAYGRPLYDRARVLAVSPLAPSEVGELAGRDALDALDAYVVVGGFPNLVHALAGSRSLAGFLRDQLDDPTSPLIVAGERALAGEFPPDVHARAVLDAIGSGRREHKSISSQSGTGGATLDRALDHLIAKRAVAKLFPYSTEPGRRRSRYEVVDPYLRFWLRFVGPALPEIERGRGREVARRTLADLPTFAGRSIEAVVREALTRLLPDRKFGRARYVSPYWTRDGRVEVDLVGGHRPDRAEHVEFLGSIKWRQQAPFDKRDLASLAAQRSKVPGGGPRTRLIAVSRAGISCEGLNHGFGPDDLLAAW